MNKVILSVDNDPRDQAMLEQIVERAHFDAEVRGVPDAQSAIAWLNGSGDYAEREKFPWPAVLVLDLKLRASHGLEVLCWLRAQPQLPALPVIVHTDSRHHSNARAALELGVNAFLNRTSLFENLVEELRTHLS